MPRPPYVLVPPSLGKAPGGRGRLRLGGGAFRRLGASRRSVVDALARALESGPDAAVTVFGARGELVDRYLGAFTALQAGRAPALAAGCRYTGVVWEHLAPSTLPDECLDRILVPSALMGLTTGADPVPDHRLGFGVSLPGLGRLDRWWRPTLTDALMRVVGDAPLVDMLPGEHAAAFDLDAMALHTEVVRVRFLAGDGRRAAGHGAKAVKGIAARVVLTHGIDGLASLRWEGWRARRVDEGIEVIGGG